MSMPYQIKIVEANEEKVNKVLKDFYTRGIEVTNIFPLERQDFDEIVIEYLPKLPKKASDNNGNKRTAVQ
jgi:hypothetical protein